MKRIKITTGQLYIGSRPIREDNYYTKISAVNIKRVKWLPRVFLNKKRVLKAEIELTDEVLKNYNPKPYVISIRSSVGIKPFPVEKYIRSKLN